MEIINTVFNDKLDIDESIIKNNSCFLDIETTGFNRSKDIIYLIGILYFDKNTKLWTLSQIFANDKDKERDLLLTTIDLLSNFDKIINYNGNVFDIPFINQRLKYYSIDQYISKDRSLDIYSIIRSNRDILNLKNLKLETIEEYLGIYRKDIYSGKDCIRFYKEYVKKKEQELKDRILQHNYDDLYYLLEVVDIINILEKKKTVTIPYNQEDINFIIDTIKHSQDYLIIRGNYISENIIKQIYYENNYTILIDTTREFEFSIEIQEGLITAEKTCLFIDSENFPIDSITINNTYELPNNIIVLKIEKKYIINNIKEVISSLLKNILH